MKDNIIEFLYPKNTKPILENTLPIKAVQNIPRWFKNLKQDMKIYKELFEGALSYVN